MPNWSSDSGRYYWTPPGKTWLESKEIPHAPIIVVDNCKCLFCEYKRKLKNESASTT
jgi:hypothetical protein